MENEHDAKSLLFVRHVLVGFKYRQVEFVKERFRCKSRKVSFFCAAIGQRLRISEFILAKERKSHIPVSSGQKLTAS